MYDDVIFSVISFVVGLLFFIPALGFGIAPTKEGTPGPGFFPVIVAAFVIVFSIALLINSLRAKEKHFKFDDVIRANMKPFLITIAAIVAYLILWKFITFFPATILFLLLLNYVYKRGWKFNIIFTIGFTAFIYFVFARLFSVMF